MSKYKNKSINYTPVDIDELLDHAIDPTKIILVDNPQQ